MAQRDFPLDPVQTQITKPVTNVTAAPVAPPQQTGLSEGLATFGKAIGGVAELVKARKFDEELKIAELDAAMRRVSPGLVSQAAIDKNHEMLDMNFSEDLISQITAWGTTQGVNIATSYSLTKIQKTDAIGNILNGYKEKFKFFTTGKAFAKADLALKKLKYDLYTTIGHHALQESQATGARHGRDKIEAWLTSENAVITTKDFKEVVEDFKALEIQNKVEIVNGKKVHVSANWNERKAAASLLFNVSLEQFETNPKAYYHIEKIIEEYLQPLADQEQALRMRGKSDNIGDNVTLQSQIDNWRKRWGEKLTVADKIAKDANEIWVSNTAFKFLAEDQNLRELGPSHIEHLVHHYGENNIYAINAAKKEINTFLKGTKHNTYSPVYFKGLDNILTGRWTDQRQIEMWGWRNKLSKQAIADLKTDLTEKHEDIQTNINSLKDQTPTFTWSVLYGALRGGIRSQHIAQGLKKLDVTLSAAVETPLLEGLVASEHIKTSTAILEPLKKLQEFMRETTLKRNILARKAAYNRRTHGKISDDEIATFIKERQKAYNDVLADYTEMIDKDPSMIVLQKKKKNKDSN